MSPKLVVVPTIDVEGTHGTRPFEQQVLGQIGAGETWGVSRIADILNRYNAAGTFFMDVYEYTFWGKEPWEHVCIDLATRNQDVQLHTHPAWRDDPRDSDQIREMKRTRSYLSQDKDFMAKLSLQEQVDVLQHGSDLLYQWLGVRPIAHRSGGYSVNEDTIIALQKTGFKIDSSQYRGHSNSKLVWSFNALAYKNGILQIPVTLYERCFVLFGPRLRGTYRKLMNSPRFSLLSELIGFCKYALKVGLPVMNLFMHSYELQNKHKYWAWIKPDPIVAQRLDNFLCWANKHPDIEIMSVQQYYQSGVWQQHVGPDAPDSVPRFAHGGQLIMDLYNKIRYTLT